ncbi:MAG: hypothetical protein M3288_02535 [Thermoproteota archaeon]|nr:hypothetical protein [Thermoproteota archaeon]
MEAILMEAQAAEEQQEVSLQAAEQQQAAQLLLRWIPLVSTNCAFSFFIRLILEVGGKL